jgi:tetratricopeptide (TPR) repeat protein
MSQPGQKEDEVDDLLREIQERHCPHATREEVLQELDVYDGDPDSVVLGFFRRREAEYMKKRGNERFAAGRYDGALKSYLVALERVPPESEHGRSALDMRLRAVLHSNRLRQRAHDGALEAAQEAVRAAGTAWAEDDV